MPTKEATPYEIALDEFRTAAMDYEDEMWDQFGVEDAPATKVMWEMIRVLWEARGQWGGTLDSGVAIRR